MSNSKPFFFISTRGNYFKLKSTLDELLRKKIKFYVIVSGIILDKEYKNLKKEIFLKYQCLKIKLPNKNFNKKQTIQNINFIGSEASKIYLKFKPKFIFIVGDRYEAFYISLIAFFYEIKIVHLEGGEESGTKDNEFRRMISSMAYIHLTATKKSMENLKNKLQFKRVYWTGTPNLDLVKKIYNKTEFNRLKIRNSKIKNFTPYDYCILSLHPDTHNLKKVQYEIEELIKALIKTNKKVIWILPNLDEGNKIIYDISKRYKSSNQFKIFDYFSFEDLSTLIYFSEFLIGNSSMIVRESSFFKKKTFLIGKRQINREKDINVISIMNTEEKNITKVVSNTTNLNKNKSIHSPYYRKDSYKRIFIILKQFKLI